MNSKIRWAIVGLGNIAHGFASSFHSEQAELVAVGSRSSQKAKSFARQYNIPKAYGSYEELYADDDIDIVYLATPNSYHAQNMMDILNAGKHVLCEKAITMNKEELDDVLLLAKEKNLLVAEAMTIYHMPIYKEVKNRIQAGEFGKLKLASAYFGSFKEADPDNRFFSPALGGGALLDIGVYALSFVQYFLDASPVEISTLVQLFETGVDEMSTISYTTTEGTLGNAVSSFRANLPQIGVVTCENAYITFHDYPRADEAVITYLDGRTETIKAGSRKDALRYEMENITLTLLSEEDFTELDNTQQVNYLIDQAAKKWEMDWIFE